MQIPKPVIDHPAEVYEAILHECGRLTRVGEHLQACGWTMGEVAWRAIRAADARGWVKHASPKTA